MHYSTIIAVLAASSCVTAAPAAAPEVGAREGTSILEKRQFQVVPHNSLRWIAEEVVPGDEGRAALRYEPFLHIAHGCRSYPAVNESGQVSGGLDNTGSPSGGCNDGSNGQTYVRGAWHRGRYAIMYSWYFPKDQISSGGGNFGHRHDWESVVIWIDNPSNANPRVFGAAASGHGDYKKVQGLPQTRNGQRLQVEYFTNSPTNHELQFKTSPGSDHAMIDYNMIDPRARKALDEHKWGSANCPFNQNNFFNNLNEAWI